MTRYQINPEIFPTGYKREVDKKPAAESPNDRSLLTRSFARAVATENAFVPDLSLYRQPIVQFIANAIRNLHSLTDGIYGGYKDQAARLTRNRSNP